MNYTLTLTTPPAADFLDDASVWDHLRVPLSGSPAEPEDKTLIDLYRDGAQAHLDGVAGILGRALITQTWTMKLTGFPCEDKIVLPAPPLQSVTSITYKDSNGDTQTFASSNYVVVTGGALAKGYVRLASGATWPATYDHPEAVTIVFVAGYGAAATDVPASIRAAGLLLVEDAYRHRSAQSIDFEVHENPAVDRLLATYRVAY